MALRRHGDEAAFSDFVLARQDRLRRVAYALCGDWTMAEDLVQEALTKLYLAWPRVRSDHDPDAYVRKILVRTNIDDHRRRLRRLSTVALTAATDDAAALPSSSVEDRHLLIDALQGLPEQQRKVVVLRHWLGLSVRDTAAELGIKEGTVKSHSSRGLAALELVMAPQRHG